MGGWKVPSPLPSNTPITPWSVPLQGHGLVTTKSGLPSPFKSPMATELAYSPPELKRATFLKRTDCGARGLDWAAASTIMRVTNSETERTDLSEFGRSSASVNFADDMIFVL